ncbi:MAG: hypothetical protein PHQ40_06335 [Anaerolineaceae bacterium]|nr:hypothetical protein [Anaerolineaceae bacterium]
MTSELNMPTLSILIVSCDHYADLWKPFFALFWKNWPDCPYKVFLGANFNKFDDARVIHLLIGQEKGWSENARLMVEQVPSEYVLLLLEDFFLRSDVNNNLIIQCLMSLSELDGGYMRLKPFPKPDRKLALSPGIGLIECGAPYRTALQAAIWEKTTLLTLLKNGETAWDFELKGSRRSDDITKGFYSTWKPLINYEAGVTLGKWLPHVLERCIKQGIEVDTGARSVMSQREENIWKLHQVINFLYYSIPWKPRRKVGDFLRWGKLLPPRSI